MGKIILILVILGIIKLFPAFFASLAQLGMIILALWFLITLGRPKSKEYKWIKVKRW
jgi:uncharacterized membrane protein